MVYQPLRHRLYEYVGSGKVDDRNDGIVSPVPMLACGRALSGRRMSLTHPSHSPDFTPSDYHFFSLTKESLRSEHYASDEELKTAVMKWLKEQ